jgi:uncharacterized protein YecT (DUF1311 family)
MTRNRWSIMAVSLLAATLPARSQSEATLQAEKAFEQADGELKAVYTMVLDKTKHPKLRHDVQAAQRAWLVFRDREGAARAGVSSQGGSAYSMDYHAARAELTKERTVQLQNLLKHL